MRRATSWMAVTAWTMWVLAGMSALSGAEPVLNTFRGKTIGFQPRHERIAAGADSGSFEAAPAPTLRTVGAEADGGLSSATIFTDDAAISSQDEAVAPLELDGGEVWMDGGATSSCDGCATDCDDCLSCERQSWFGCNLWWRAEYLLWWTESMDVVPLVTTSPTGTAQDRAGVLGQTGTQVLVGGGELHDDARSGGRFMLGTWLDPYQMHGLDATYIVIAEQNALYSDSLDERTILARPFFNVTDNAQDARLVRFPNLVDGDVSVQSETDFETFELLYRRCLCQYEDDCGLFGRTEFLAGYRYARLYDLVRINEFTRSLSGPTSGATFDLFDDFSTSNTFQGGELGLRYLRDPSPGWSCELVAKVGLGNTQSRGRVRGNTVITTADGDVASTGSGLLAQSTNIGTFETNEFGTFSELGLSVKRQLSCGITATFGYNLLYWTEPQRAGQQIDPRVNTSQIPPGNLSGAPLPSYLFDNSNFWAQGLHFGLEYMF